MSKIKKIGLGVVGVFVLLIIIGMVAGNSGPKKVGEESQSGKIENQQFKIGDKINVQDRILIVNSVDKKWRSSNQFDTPTSPNKLWVVVNVTIENASNTEVAFNPFDFKIQDSNGVQSSFGFGGVGLDKLSSGNLIAGGKVSGNLIFEVDKTATTNLILIYQPSFWSGQAAKIQLQ